MKNLLVAQSGGPSAAINATITGVIDAGIESGRVGHVYGALNGIKGVLNENFVNLDEVCDTKEKRDLLAITPAAALGSCRWTLGDPKENAEHVMLVDLARNDLSRNCHDVQVEFYKEAQYYSHVIHLVSRVSGELNPKANPIKAFIDTFPAGTLSGAPKVKAMQLISEYEPHSRGAYGGCIGFIGLNGTLNQAITIRTFVSRNNELWFQAGGGIVAKSNEEYELQEVNNKLGALKKAIILAEQM